MRRICLAAVVAVCAAALPASAALADSPHSPAASGYTLFGAATLVHPGEASPTAAEATSTGTPGYGGSTSPSQPG